VNELNSGMFVLILSCCFFYLRSYWSRWSSWFTW